MKNIVILGSTGSIGTQTIDVLDSIEAQVCAISVNTNIQRAEQQARALHPSLVAVYNEEKAKELKTKLADTDIRVVSGMDGLIEAATLPEADVVVTAVVGMVGLLPTMAAIEAGKAIALANKETLVCEALPGLYPCGEGAGYAGGIMTAAVDGVRCAAELMKRYKPCE